MLQEIQKNIPDFHPYSVYKCGELELYKMKIIRQKLYVNLYGEIELDEEDRDVALTDMEKDWVLSMPYDGPLSALEAINFLSKGCDYYDELSV